MKHLKTFLIIFFLAGLLVPAVSLSAGFGSAGQIFKDVGSKSGADTYKNVEDIIGTGINIALTLVGLIFLILMVYAGYLWMTARGEEDKIKKSQDIIIAAIIGLVIVLSAYAITKLVTIKLAPSETTGSAEITLQQAQADAQASYVACQANRTDVCASCQDASNCQTVSNCQEKQQLNIACTKP